MKVIYCAIVPEGKTVAAVMEPYESIHAVLRSSSARCTLVFRLSR